MNGKGEPPDPKSPEAAMMLAEYNHRRMLNDIGITLSAEELDSVTADCFIEIGKQLAKMEQEAAERAKAKRK